VQAKRIATREELAVKGRGRPLAAHPECALERRGARLGELTKLILPMKPELAAVRRVFVPE
jgi:hypothetical protein